MRRPLLFLLLMMMGLAPPDARSEEKIAREAAEAILVQSLLERSAFLACANAARDGEAASSIRRMWDLDLSEAMEVLRSAGLPDAYLAALGERLALGRIEPTLAQAAADPTFCAAVGDWERRYSMFFALFPQLRLKEALKR